MEDQTIHVQVILYNLDKTVDSGGTDIKIYATLGEIRIIFLNWFVTNVLVCLLKCY